MKTMRELVKNALIRVPDKVPKGFKTREQWVIELGIEKNKIARALKNLVEEGAVEMKLFRGVGMIRKMPHYREK